MLGEIVCHLVMHMLLVFLDRVIMGTQGRKARGALVVVVVIVVALAGAGAASSTVPAWTAHCLVSWEEKDNFEKWM